MTDIAEFDEGLSIGPFSRNFLRSSAALPSRSGSPEAFE